MKYGQPVAYVTAGELRFGVIQEIINREGKDGETTEYVIQSIFEDQSSPTDVVTNREMIEVIEPKYPSLIGDRVRNLFDKTSSFDWAMKRSEELLNPKQPTTPAPEPSLTETLISIATPPKEEDVPL
jgi:hypothetical protein